MRARSPQRNSQMELLVLPLGQAIDEGWRVADLLDEVRARVRWVLQEDVQELELTSHGGRLHEGDPVEAVLGDGDLVRTACSAPSVRGPGSSRGAPPWQVPAWAQEQDAAVPLAPRAVPRGTPPRAAPGCAGARGGPAAEAAAERSRSPPARGMVTPPPLPAAAGAGAARGPGTPPPLPPALDGKEYGRWPALTKAAFDGDAGLVEEPGLCSPVAPARASSCCTIVGVRG
ncbi:unnamed protein product [Prorocentrum cordatum]|uniref:Uncharacterized protein n=1 Tax=Prorocentrum cordatum TaxID=2364126 RepID=A0ABN9VM81_9DINO|nr:unnamed protein product [Polarella glacialis]